MSGTTNVGLSPEHLLKAYPFHIGIDKDFKIFQLGSRIMSLFANQMNHISKSTNVTSDQCYLIGKPITDFFNIISPYKCKWDWKSINMAKDTTFELELKQDCLSLISTTKRKISRLAVHGGILICDPKIDKTVDKFYALFLLHLKVKSLSDLSDNGFSLNDLSRYALQRELLLIGEHLNCEVKSAKRFDMQCKTLNIERERAQSLLETKRAFVRYVSHEIRTPLNIVNMGLNLLNKTINSFGNEEARELISDMQKSSTVAVEILNDLLTYEKIESNLLVLELKEVHIYEIIYNTVQFFRIQAQSSNIELSYQLSLLRGIYVMADSSKLTQVIRNLLSNALKFSPVNGKVNIQVLVYYEEYGWVTEIPPSQCLSPSEIRICVTDNGAGIALDDQITLFQEFKQLNANKLQNGGGSGLGLWICKNIMEYLRGSIGVYSDGENQGSTFFISMFIHRISIPSMSRGTSKTEAQLNLLLDVDDLSSSIDDSDYTSNSLDMSPTCGTIIRSPSRPLQIRSILVVDDSKLNRKMIIRLLKDKVPSIDEAEDGQVCLEVYKRYFKENLIPYDVIMMDFIMPKLSGPETVKILREMGYKGLIVGVTGNSMQSDIDEFMASGVNKVLVKPLDIDEFFSYCNKWLGN